MRIPPADIQQEQYADSRSRYAYVEQPTWAGAVAHHGPHAYEVAQLPWRVAQRARYLRLSGARRYDMARSQIALDLAGILGVSSDEQWALRRAGAVPGCGHKISPSRVAAIMRGAHRIGVQATDRQMATVWGELAAGPHPQIADAMWHVYSLLLIDSSPPTAELVAKIADNQAARMAWREAAEYSCVRPLSLAACGISRKLVARAWGVRLDKRRWADTMGQRWRMLPREFVERVTALDCPTDYPLGLLIEMAGISQDMRWWGGFIGAQQRAEIARAAYDAGIPLQRDIAALAAIIATQDGVDEDSRVYISLGNSPAEQITTADELRAAGERHNNCLDNPEWADSMMEGRLIFVRVGRAVAEIEVATRRIIQCRGTNNRDATAEEMALARKVSKLPFWRYETKEEEQARKARELLRFERDENYYRDLIRW